MSDVVWTPEAKRGLYSTRKQPNPQWRDDLLERVSMRWPLDLATARKGAEAYWEDRDDLQRVKQGFDHNPPAWRPVVEQVIARCSNHKQASNELDVDVEAAMVTLEMCQLFNAVPYWIAAAGIPFALRALIKTAEITSSWATKGYGDHGLWIVESKTISFDRPRNNSQAWELMRAVIAEAIEPVYDEAHGIADAAFVASAGRTPNESVLQVMIPYAFPEEKAWAKTGAVSALGLAKQRKRASTPQLARFLSVAPVDAAVELLSCTVNDAVTAEDLWSALAHHGAAGGVKILEAALTHAPNTRDRELFGEVLVAIRTADALKAWERLAKHPKGKKTFQPFADRHRETMLANAATKPGKRGAKRP